MGYDYKSFDGVDYYGKYTFTCFLPPVGIAMGGGGQGRVNRGGGRIGGGGMAAGNF